MAADDTPGPKKQPRFKGTGAPATAADLVIVSDFAALVGNRKVGTTTERNTATSNGEVWEGLRWKDTTLGVEFEYISGGWVRIAWASGNVVCPGTGSGASPVYWSDLIDVTFPTNRFSAAPRVFCQTVGPVTQVQFGGTVEQITATGCKVRGIRLLAVPTNQWSVDWFAIA